MQPFDDMCVYEYVCTLPEIQQQASAAAAPVYQAAINSTRYTGVYSSALCTFETKPDVIVCRQGPMLCTRTAAVFAFICNTGRDGRARDDRTAVLYMRTAVLARRAVLR